MRNEERKTLLTKLLISVAVTGTPVVLAAMLVELAQETNATLGAVHGQPTNLADPQPEMPKPEQRRKPELHIDIGPKNMDDPIQLPFEKPLRLRIEVKEEAPKALPACDPVQVIRDSFKPSRERCREVVPSV